jgi:hypothetical protein
VTWNLASRNSAALYALREPGNGGCDVHRVDEFFRNSDRNHLHGHGRMLLQGIIGSIVDWRLTRMVTVRASS